MQPRSTIAASLILSLVFFQIPVPQAGGQTSPAPQTQTTALPSPEQLKTFLAPIALYPDQLLAQICTAAEDPQQLLNVDQWLKQQGSLKGQPLTDAAQKQNFDPAFLALINFPQVLDQMAKNISTYAAIGLAYQTDQKPVQQAIQKLRSEAYASGALRTNEKMTVTTSTQNGQQVIVINSADPNVVYIPQYNPQVVYVSSGPSTGDAVAASLITFGAGIALGAWISNSYYPWGWGGWGWHWGYYPPRPPYPPPPPHWGPPGPGPGPGPCPGCGGSGTRYPPGPGPNPGPNPHPGPGPNPPPGPGPNPGTRPGANGGGVQNPTTRPGANGGGIQNGAMQTRPGAKGAGTAHPYSGYEAPSSSFGGFGAGNGASARQWQQRGTRSFGGGRFGGRR